MARETAGRWLADVPERRCLHRLRDEANAADEASCREDEEKEMALRELQSVPCIFVDALVPARHVRDRRPGWALSLSLWWFEVPKTESGRGSQSCAMRGGKMKLLTGCFPCLAGLARSGWAGLQRGHERRFRAGACRYWLAGAALDGG
jgi:hypothetical protein